ncbi:MAG: DUF5916 domain-containing protein, partial [Melioribacteraceae bacterium]|nr:DUF5916 domain-containing protein [Melioribacteraceae bacterium]
EYKKKLDIGLDAKYLLTSNLTLDLSLNTDFAQVEADQEQVNLTRFELFFPEKREFFLERANVFRFGERALFPMIPPSVLFFSRRIGLSEDNELVPLIGGVKLTGRSSSYDIGFLNMLADETSYINDDESVSIPRTNFSVLRMQKDLGNNSTLGMIGLNKESLDDNDYNRVLGIDANIFLNDHTQVGAFIAKSFSDDMKGNDYVFNGDFLYLDDFWLAYAAQNSIQENFSSEMGFVPRTGIRRTQLNVGISPRPGILNIRKITFFNNLNYFANQDNKLETRFNLIGIFTVLNNGANVFLGHANNYERLTEDFEIYEDVIIPQDIYKFNNFWGEFRSDQSKIISGKLGTNFGDFFDGDIFSYSLGLNLKLGSRFTAEVEYNRNNVKLPVGNFIATIMSTRFIYTFSPKLFVKAFIQWNSDTETVIGNFLLNLIHTPGGDLYLVYNEELEKGRSKFNTINRSVLVKFTHLFSF